MFLLADETVERKPVYGTVQLARGRTRNISMYYPSAVHLDYDPPIPIAATPVSAVSNCVLSRNGCLDRSDLIQTVCQLYDVVDGEYVHSRKTALIQHGSPLHPYSICNPNYGGHELCLPLAVDYVLSDLAPPTMAHHFYYLHVRDAKIPASMKNDIYRQLYHTAPFDLFAKYTELRSRFDLISLKECRSLMLSILDFWIQHCKRLKLCLDATKFFPVRLQWTDSVFEGTRLERNQLSQNWEVGYKIDEYGWAIEMVRAERLTAFTENCPLIFVGDNTSTRLARYIEWGKQLSDIDGRFLQQFESKSGKLEESERMSTLFLLLQKIHFGNGCIAVILSSGARELAEGMAPSKYGKLLKNIIMYLLQFQLRILVVPPTPRMENQFLWFQYVQQQVELSIKLSTVEFLVRSAQQASDRCFLDALLIGSRTLDSFICDNSGFTDFGIKKLGFFLIEVMHIPRTGHNGQISKHEVITDTTSRRDDVIFACDYKGRNIDNIEQQSQRLVETQAKVWYQSSADYESINSVPSSSSMASSDLLPTAVSYLDLKSYSELAGYTGPAVAENLLMPVATSVQNLRHRKKKTGIVETSHSSIIDIGHLQRQEQRIMINSSKKLGQFPKLLRRKYFTLTQERYDRRRRARVRRATEQLNN
uniref:Macro domain-containing protein n=1 Tax=Elaeophora elaphi TaxID=1147741 RepID=A0A0R3RS22_9BILA